MASCDVSRGLESVCPFHFSRCRGRRLNLHFNRLCRDAALLHDVWKTFDAAGGSSVYAELVSALRRIISEKPSELGINQSMQGIGVDYSTPDSSNKGYFDIGLNAVSSAANAGVSTVSAIIGSESEGRLDSTSSLKVQWYARSDQIYRIPKSDLQAIQHRTARQD